MKEFKNMFFGIFFVIFAQGCATVGTINEAVVEGVADTTETVFTGLSKVTGAVVNEAGNALQTGAELGVGIVQGAGDIVAGSVEVVADSVNESTDAVQDKKEEAKEEPKK